MSRTVQRAAQTRHGWVKVLPRVGRAEVFALPILGGQRLLRRLAFGSREALPRSNAL
jgi:hypothetical protein